MLRRPVLSLAAIFVALAVGMVLGARVLPGLGGSGFGHSGSGDAAARQQLSALRENTKTLNEKLSAASQFDAAMAGRMVHNALAGKSVVLFFTPDAEDEDVEGLRKLVGEAGGSVVGKVGLTQEFVAGNSAEKLRSVVNSSIVPAGARLDPALVDPASQAGDLLGIVLLTNRDPKQTEVGDAARKTVLAALHDTGFLTFDPMPGATVPGATVPDATVPDATMPDARAADTAVLVTGRGLADDAGSQGTTVAHLSVGLAQHGSGTVLAGRDGSAAGVSAVALVRADPAMASAVSTVDDIGTPSGRITAVLALEAMIGGAPPSGYGIGQGAAAVTVPQ